MVFFTGQRVISVFLCDLASLRSVSGPYCKVPTAQEPIEYVDEPPCSIVEVYIADIGLGRTFEMYVDQPLCISNTSLTFLCICLRNGKAMQADMSQSEFIWIR
jgi:hypothetical protein